MQAVLKLLVMVVVLSAIAPYACAEENGWYLVADLGYAKFNQTSTYTQPAMVAPVADESGGGYRIGGGYRFTDYFAMEAGYLDAGHTDVGPDAVLPKFGNQNRIMRTRGISIDAVGSIRLSDAIALHVRAGVISATTEHKLFRDGSTVQTGPDLMEHDTRFGMGTGVAYQFDQNWTIRMQWQRFFGLGGAEAAARYDLSIATLGVAYYY
jgi:OmpA-OmpF porin, OOP family